MEAGFPFPSAEILCAMASRKFVQHTVNIKVEYWVLKVSTKGLAIYSYMARDSLGWQSNLYVYGHRMIAEIAV